MPKRTRTRSKSRNVRPYKKRYSQDVYSPMSRNQATMAMYNGGVPRPLGRQIKAEHSYAVVNIQLNPGISGLASNYVFSVNGMFDPDITGVGTQPVGFDNMTGLFDHYTVIHSKIRVDFYSSDNATSVCCGVLVKDNASTSNNVMNLLCGESVSSMVDPQNPTTMISKSVNVSKFLGRPNILSEDDCRGSSTSNPAEQAYYHVFAQPNSTNDVSSLFCVVRIDYVAVWTEPLSLSNS